MQLYLSVMDFKDLQWCMWHYSWVPWY